MPISNALASVAVKDLKSSSEWYAALFGRPADSQPMAGLVAWRFARGGWLQVYELAERAGSGSVTLTVNDMQEVVAHLKAIGIDTSQRSFGEGMNTLMITDPDGNHIAFAETIDPVVSQVPPQ
jgi:hypothetical protein